MMNDGTNTTRNSRKEQILQGIQPQETTIETSHMVKIGKEGWKEGRSLFEDPIEL